MIYFGSISSFRKCVAALLKVRRGIYSGVISEICSAFYNVPIEQIRLNRDMILASNEYLIIKQRLPDKRQYLSKSEGFRLVYMVMKQIELVIFLQVYPKRGPLQKINLEVNELTELLNEFTEEFRCGQIVFHDINNNLQELQ